jgi:hypothetical protein
MSQAEFEPTIPARNRPQTQGLNRAATQIGPTISIQNIITKYYNNSVNISLVSLFAA